MSKKSSQFTRKPIALAPITLAVDIGGTGIKALLLDSKGGIASDELRLPTPRPATPRAVNKTIVTLAERLVAESGRYDRVSVGFPGVVQNGVPLTAVNLHPKWKHYELEKELTERLKAPVRVSNDANIQGLGAIENRGVELVMTLGTGVGFGLYIDGHAIPNIEMGHHPFQKDKTYEQLLGDAQCKRDRKRWNKRLKAAIQLLDQTFNYDQLLIGGGNARWISFKLPQRVRVIPNLAGLTGGIALWR